VVGDGDAESLVEPLADLFLGVVDVARRGGGGVGRVVVRDDLDDRFRIRRVAVVRIRAGSFGVGTFGQQPLGDLGKLRGVDRLLEELVGTVVVQRLRSVLAAAVHRAHDDDRGLHAVGRLLEVLADLEAATFGQHRLD
jgi:hypothetical protein